MGICYYIYYGFLIFKWDVKVGIYILMKYVIFIDSSVRKKWSRCFIFYWKIII